ncbi:MAG TPA: TetR/AcrR family transcriptional regulator [Phenylobacterium sp.]|nr:TetR/AcrR family transcriptional regulator [Phenylobacterium sp.]
MSHAIDYSPQRGARPYHMGNVRNRLLAAAKTILERDGRDHLQLRAIAALTGVSAPTVYYHYADKHSLLGALAREGFLALSATLEHADAGETGGPGLRAISASYLDFVDAHPALYRLMYELRDSEPTAEVVAAEDAALAAMRLAVGRALSDRAPDEAVANLAEVLWAFGRGAAAVGLARGHPGGAPACGWTHRALLGLALLDTGGLLAAVAAWAPPGTM